MGTWIRKWVEPEGRKAFRASLPFLGGLILALALWSIALGIGNVPGVPQFFGAMVGAGAALVGVLVGALYNARLTRERDDREAARKSRAVFNASLIEFDVEIGDMGIGEHLLGGWLVAANNEGDYQRIVRGIVEGVPDLPTTAITDAHLLVLCEDPAVADALVRFVDNRKSCLETQKALATSDGVPMHLLMRRCTQFWKQYGLMRKSAVVTQQALKVHKEQLDAKAG